MAMEAAIEMFDKNFKDLTDVDKRILNSLHPEIKTIFEEKFKNYKQLQQSMLEKSMVLNGTLRSLGDQKLQDQLESVEYDRRDQASRYK